ncbi:MAG: CoA transferase [Alphaproteobacteria bacterium]
MSGDLDGIRVLKINNYVARPYAGMILGDTVTKVIKVENPEGRDPFQIQGNKKISPIFESLSRNKKTSPPDSFEHAQIDNLAPEAAISDPVMGIHDLLSSDLILAETPLESPSRALRVKERNSDFF